MTDRELQEHVRNALAWEPSIDDADIGVSVDAGVVALRGVVGTFSEKTSAERVALRVYGVKGVANELDVRPGHGQLRSDVEIAQTVLSALKWNSLVPAEKISVIGWSPALNVASNRFVMTSLCNKNKTRTSPFFRRVLPSQVVDRMNRSFL
jgi:hypothetical protein